ncbi:MAG: hypothetical protein ACPLKS_04745 [Caldisericum exile]|uniref:hypothetical protein n=1 Tax=Caldisericum exile TaxID=693075 RepID=UPI003C75DFE6
MKDITCSNCKKTIKRTDVVWREIDVFDDAGYTLLKAYCPYCNGNLRGKVMIAIEEDGYE